MTTLVTAEDVAGTLAMSPRWVLAEARAGRLPCYRVSRCIRFDEAEVAAWLAEHHCPASADRRITYPIAPANPAHHAGSRGRVPTVSPPAALYPAETGSR